MPNKINSLLPLPNNAFLFPPLALRSVTSKSGMGVYASSDTLFKGAVFGRDSLVAAEDVMTLRPTLVRSILLTLASLQGVEKNDANEEEPGKIVHEYRNIIVDGKKINKVSLSIFNELSYKWGGNATELIYYGSVDATPHFLRTLGTYCQHYGNEILETPVTLQNGKTVPLISVAQAATDWLLKKIKSSVVGLVEYKRMNPHGILNQVWKDSEEFYIHENGEDANHDRPIASIEVQGIAYDALLAAAQFFPYTADQYIQTAHQLRDTTIKLLWKEDHAYFALGVDYDTTGKPRVMHTITANPASLLNSGIFSGLDQKKREKYVSGITKMIFGWNFLTNAGVRSRALSASGLVPFWDYHGSFVSWPKETYDVVKGLRRFGMPLLARQLENRLVNIVLKNRGYPEFVYVDNKGKVLIRSSPTNKHGELILVNSTNNPERMQTWTVTAALAIISQRLSDSIKLTLPKKETWQASLEKEMLKLIPKVSTHFNPLVLRSKYPNHVYLLKKDK